MKYLLTLLIVLTYPLIGTECTFSSGDETLEIAGRCVNTNSGSFFQKFNLINIPGPDPLNFSPFYDSKEENNRSLGYSLCSNFKSEIVLDLTIPKSYFTMQEGAIIPLVVSHPIPHAEIWKLDPATYKSGYSNCSLLSLNRNLTPDAMYLKYLVNQKNENKDSWVLTLGDGTVQTYQLCGIDEKRLKYRSHLVKEVLPSGNLRKYSYGGDWEHPTKVITTSSDGSEILNSLTFQKVGQWIVAKGSSEQWANIEIGKKKNFIGKYKKVPKKISSSHLPTYDCDFESTIDSFSLRTIREPKINGLRIGYNSGFRSGFEGLRGNANDIDFGEGKVNSVKFTDSKDQRHDFYEFKYFIHPLLNGKKNPHGAYHTNVINPLGELVTFRYDHNCRLKSIEDNFRFKRYNFDSNGKLLAKGILNRRGKNYLATRGDFFKYDNKGNIIQHTVSGKITGNENQLFPFETTPPSNIEKSITQYSYTKDRFNSLLKKTLPNGSEVKFSYKPGTNLLTKKLTLDKGKIKLREFYSYDKCAIQILKIEDDGSGEKQDDLTDVTYRLITHIKPNMEDPGKTLPAEIYENYFDLDLNEEVELKRTCFTYTQGAQVAKTAVYDSNDHLLYQEEKEYGKKQELIREINPLNEVTEYKYDENLRLISQTKLGSQKETCIKYNLFDEWSVKIDRFLDGQSAKIERREFNTIGDLLSQTNRYRQKTKYTYDSGRRLIKEVDPLRNETKWTYDILDHVISETDKRGFTTHYERNIFGSPTKIIYPDQTVETFLYDNSNNCIQHIEINGTKHVYTKDFLGHTTEHKTFSNTGELVRTLSWKYKGEKLTHFTNGNGVVTEYFYDYAGRKVKECTDQKITTFSYDSAGRLWKTYLWNEDQAHVSVVEYDLLNRPIVKTVEDEAGNIYRKVAFTYDINGNLVSEHQFYDENMSGETITEYNAEGLPVRRIDPEGNETLISYQHSDHLEKTTIDSLGQTTLEVYDRLQRLVLEEIRKDNALLSRQRLSYDSEGNKIKQIDSIIEDGIEIGTNAVEYTYDSMGRVIKEVEQGEKVTEYTYLCGKLHTIKKPDGVILTHTYDPFGQLISLISSDDTIHHTFTFDDCGNVVKAEDHLSKKLTTRKYDSLGNLIQETLANGLSLSFEYDPLSRISTLTLPDQSTVTFDYNTVDLHHVARNNNQITLYHNLAGSLTELDSSVNHIDYAYDLAGKLTHIHSKAFSQSYDYDSVGNLTSSHIQDPLGSYTARYRYDPLYQLIEEEGVFNDRYTCDSLNNRRSKNGLDYSLNNLHQVLNDGEIPYTYDKNGNRTSKGDTFYFYDALNKLNKVKDLTSVHTYNYDPFGRLITKDDTHYLYFKDHEIGSVKENTLQDLRLIHNNHTLFIELNGVFYIPNVNHRGDITTLSNSNHTATYRYSAFGESMHVGSIHSPWCFSSQRYDRDLSLYHFPKRLYDPSLGRWLTPDPLGLAEGPNLYAYVHNSPLSYTDPFGLFMVCAAFDENALNDSLQFNQYGGNSPYSYGFSAQLSTFTNSFSEIGLSLLQGYERDQTSPFATIRSELGLCDYIPHTSGPYSSGYHQDHPNLSGTEMMIRQGAYFLGELSSNVETILGCASPITSGVKGAMKKAGKYLVRDGAYSLYKRATMCPTNKNTAGQVQRTGGKFFNFETSPAPTPAPVSTPKKSSYPPGHFWESGSPIREKSAQEIHDMFMAKKGYEDRGLNAENGLGSYINTKNFRQYKMDPKNVGRYQEPNHMDVSRPKGYKGPLKKKRFRYKDD